MKSFGIRYLRIRVRLEMKSGCFLPKAKASMLRGGIGDMLMKRHCLNNGACESCGFHDDCIVQKVMYSAFDKAPSFMRENASLGYIVVCEDYRESYDEGDLLEFRLVLFGREIAYLGCIVQAIYDLGDAGLSADRAEYRVGGLQNDNGEEILRSNHSLIAEAVSPVLLDDYVAKRLSDFGVPEDGKRALTIIFQNETSLTEKKKDIEEFDPDAVGRALLLRINLMREYEKGTSEGVDIWKPPEPVPRLLEQESQPIAVPRYSSRKQQKIYLNGIKGRMTVSNVTNEWLGLFLAGEILHIGKNTSFGFGKYIVVEDVKEEMRG